MDSKGLWLVLFTNEKSVESAIWDQREVEGAAWHGGHSDLTPKRDGQNDFSVVQQDQDDGCPYMGQEFASPLRDSDECLPMFRFLRILKFRIFGLLHLAFF